MKTHPLHLLLAASLLASQAQAGGSCDPHAQKRVVTGKQPTADTLYAHLQQAHAGPWVAGFDTETFAYIGEVHAKSGKRYKVGYLKTLGGRTCIAFERLYLFDDKGTYLGQYAPVEVDPAKVKIEGSSLSFPFKDGNVLDLGKGPPAQVRLDGDDVNWEPASAP